MENKRVLLIGASFSAVPIFLKLKSYGFCVEVCGVRKDDPCHQYADKSYYLDYSDREALLRLVEKEKFLFIIPSCNDYSYVSGAYVAEKLNYPGFDNLETVNIIHTKNLFKEFCDELDIPSPKSIRCNKESFQNSLKFPLIVKPINIFSGIGVTKVNESNNLFKAIDVAQKHSGKDTVVVEEFKEGTLHSHSAFIEDGKIYNDVFADEFCTVYPFQVNCSNHPSVLSDNIKNKVRQVILKLINSLKLGNGLLHTQFIYQEKTQDIWIIEPMRRAPGDLYGKMINLSIGLDYFDFYIRPFIGKKYLAYSYPITPKYYGRHTVSVNQKTIVCSYTQNIPAANNIEVVPLKKSGELLDVAPFDKYSILFAEFHSFSEMLAYTHRFNEFIQIKAE